MHKQLYIQALLFREQGSIHLSPCECRRRHEMNAVGLGLKDRVTCMDHGFTTATAILRSSNVACL